MCDTPAGADPGFQKKRGGGHNTLGFFRTAASLESRASPKKADERGVSKGFKGGGGGGGGGHGPDVPPLKPPLHLNSSITLRIPPCGCLCHF